MAYDSETGTYRAAFDRGPEAVSLAVVSTVAAVTGTDPVELDRLYSVVDPESLGALFESARTGPASGDVRVTFTYEECAVTVHSYGIVAVRPPETATDG